MSTTQDRPRHANKLRSRFGAGLLALTALIAVGVGVLLLALTDANREHTTSSSIAGGQLNDQTVRAARPCYFRDPVTHRLLRIHPKPCDPAPLQVDEFGDPAP
jgi:hypothetical protein